MPELKDTLSRANSNMLSTMYRALDTLDDIFNLINIAIVDDPPMSVKEGGLIKKDMTNKLMNLLT